MSNEIVEISVLAQTAAYKAAKTPLILAEIEKVFSLAVEAELNGEYEKLPECKHVLQSLDESSGEAYENYKTICLIMICGCNFTSKYTDDVNSPRRNPGAIFIFFERF